MAIVTKKIKPVELIVPAKAVPPVAEPSGEGSDGDSSLPDFQKARPKIPYEKYKHAHFMWSGETSGISEIKGQVAGKSVSIEIPYFEVPGNIEKPGNGETVTFANFTLVKTDGIQKKLERSDGSSAIIVKVTVVDTDPYFAPPEVGLSVSSFSKQGSTYWVDANKVWSIEPALTPDVPQLPTPIKSISETKDIVPADWFTKAHGTILEDKSSFFVAIDTMAKGWKDKDDEGTVKLQAKTAAANIVGGAYGLIMNPDTESLFVRYATVIKDQISNRPGSTYRICVKIPKELLSVEARALTPDQSSVAFVAQMSFGELKNSLTKIEKYFLSLSPIIKKENISLNLQLETKLLKKARTAVIGLFADNKQHKTQDTDQIYITFTLEPETIMNGLIVEPTAALKKRKTKKVIKKNASLKKDEDTFAPITKPITIDTRTKLNDDLYKRSRTMLFIANCQSMAEEIGKDTNAATNKVKWLDFLIKYVDRMPMYYPSDTINKETNDSNVEAKQKIKDIEKKLPPVTTIEVQNALLKDVTPELKGKIAQIKATTFEKIQDPSMKMIFDNIEQINSIDSLYEQVLDKISIESMISLAKECTEPNYFNSIEDSVPNLDFEIPDPKLNIPKIPDLDVGIPDLNYEIPELPELPSLSNPLAFDLPDLDIVPDVSSDSQEKIVAQIEEMMTSALLDTVKSIIRNIKRCSNEGSDKEKNKKVGDLDITSKLQDNQLENIKNKINSIADADLEQNETKDILKVISDYSTPLEVVALFRGDADVEILDILSKELSRFPVLGDNLSNLYDTEEFLMSIGENISDLIEASVGDNLIKQGKELDFSPFCEFNSPGIETETEAVINHLSNRFPEKFSNDQLANNDQRRKEFGEFLDNLETALDNNLDEFLFGDRLNDLLDDMTKDDESSLFMKDLVFKSFFEPIVAEFDVESMNAGFSFLENTVEEIAKSAADGGINRLDIKPVTNKDLANSENFEELKDQADAAELKAVIGLKDPIKRLRASLASRTLATWTREKQTGSPVEFRFVINDKSYLTISYSVIQSAIFSPPPVENALPIPPAYIGIPEEEEQDKEAQEYTVTVKAVMDSKEILSTVHTVDVTKLKIFNMISTTGAEDSTPQASAYATLISNILEKNFPKETTEEPDKLQSFLDMTRTYLFFLLNQGTINLLGRQAYASSFFNPLNLIKLRLATDEADNREPPLLCDELDTEEGNVRDPLIPNMIDMDDILIEGGKNKKYFTLLQKEKNKKIYNRTPIDNSVIMISIPLFFRTFVIEYLLSGIFVFNEVDPASFLGNKTNFKMIHQIIFATLEDLGEEFKNNFYDILEQYLHIRQTVDSETYGIAPMPADIKSEDLGEVFNFLLDEELKLIFPSFERATQLVSDRDKLEVSDFVDVIPELETHKAVAVGPSPPGPFHLAQTANSPPGKVILSLEKKKNVLKYGGFIIQRYIRPDWKVSLLPTDLKKSIEEGKNKLRFKDTAPASIATTKDFDQNTWYKTGNLSGVVNLEIFEDLQQKIEQKNKDLASAFKETHKEELFDLSDLKSSDVLLDGLAADRKELVAKWNIYASALDASYNLYETTFNETYDFALQEPYKDTKSYSDKFIFDWSDLEQETITLDFNSVAQMVKNFDEKEKEEYNKALVEKSMSGLEYIKSLEGDALTSFLEVLGDKGDIFKQLDNKYKTLTSSFKTMENETSSLIGALKLYSHESVQFLDGKKVWSGEGIPPDGAISEADYNKVIDSKNKANARIQALNDMKINENMDGLKETSEKIDKINDEISTATTGINYPHPDKFLDEQIEALEEKLKSEREIGMISGAYDEYLNSLKYGIRICYVYPMMDDDFNNQDSGVFNEKLIGDVGAEMTLLTKMKEEYNVLTGDLNASKNRREKAFKVREHLMDATGHHTKTYYMTPLVSFESEVSEFFTNDVPGEVQESPTVVPQLTNKKIIDNFPWRSLKKSLAETDEYKKIFSEMLMLPDLVSALGVFCSMHTIEELYKKTNLGIYSGTKTMLKNMLNNVAIPKNYKYLAPAPTLSEKKKKDLALLNNPAGDYSPSQTSPTSVVGSAAILAAKFPLFVLKGLVEATDPAIIQGKKIQAGFNALLKAGDAVAAKAKKEEMGAASAEEQKKSEGNPDKPKAKTDSAPGFSLLASVLLGLPSPPFPPPLFFPGNITAPLTPLGAAYLAISATLSGNNPDAGTETDQDKEKTNNPEQICIDNKS